MKKRVCLCVIVCLIGFSVLFAMETEEQVFRDELEIRRAEMEISYEEYREILLKLLEPRSQWDAGITFLLFPLAAMALAIVIVFFVRQIRMNLITEAFDDASDTALEHVETEKTALARADTAEAASDFRGALRFLYLSAIFHLQERGMLPYDKSLTNREYLRQAQTDIDLHTALGPAITVFDEVWYGHKPCDAETVANYRDLLQKVYVRN